MVLGHLTVTAAGRRLLGFRWISLAPLILGAYLPDLVDKSIALVSRQPGRSFGHSLIVGSLVFAVAVAALPKHRRVVGTLALGVALHLLEDWVDPVVLFAPLLGPIPPRPRWNFFESVVRFYSRGGPQVWLEVAALLYWLGVAAGLNRARPARG